MPRGRNPNYWVVVTCASQGLTIIADMPEQTGYATGSSYDSATGMVLGSLIPNIPLPFLRGAANAQGERNRVTVGGDTAATAIGGDALLKDLTKKIWKGTNHIGFTLSLLFDAESNSKKDVHDKCALLASLSLPGRLGFTGGHVLLPPNPTRFTSDINKIEIRLGRQTRWESVVIESATVVGENRLNAGFPIAGQIDLQCASDYIYDKDDLMNAMGVYLPNGFDAPSANSESSSLTPAQAAAARRQ